MCFETRTARSRAYGWRVGDRDGGPCPVDYRLVLALQLKKTTGDLGHNQEMVGTFIFLFMYLGFIHDDGRVERTKLVMGE
jgi:hypothetical protein